MKKAATIIILVSFICIGHTQPNSNYYWSGKRKISLVPDSTSWTLIPVRGYSKEAASSQIKNINMVSNLQTSIGSELIDFTLKDHSKEAVRKLKLNLALHGEITCRQLVEGKSPITLTGEILVQPKKSVPIDNVLDLVRAKVKLINRTEYNTFVLKANRIEDVTSIANQIYESGLVDWCHPDFWAEIVKTTADPLYNQQYYLNQANNIDINAPEAFAITQGCNNIRVAVIDDGVENHEDINGRVLQGFTARNANGFGAPVANLPPVNLTRIGHGQACAGIIGATQDNNLGIGGIAPNSRIIPVNIFSDWFIFTDGFGNQTVLFRETAQDLTASINWAWNANQGNADVISNSWGFGNTTGPGGVDADAIRQAITNARTQGRFRNGAARGCVVVFASGNANNSFSGVTFPANVDGVITVGAIDRNGNIWNYSSRGSEMDLVAPTGNTDNQGDVNTTDRMGNNGYDPGNYVGTFGGTSAACPQVSGVAALMISVNPNLTELNVRTILQQTATDMGATGFDNTFGFGRVNAEAALRRIITDLGISLTGTNLVCTNPNGQLTLNNPPAGSTVTWSSSNPSGVSFNPTTGNITTPTRVNNFNGQVTIIATVTGLCGNYNLTQDVWVGNPPATNSTLIWTGIRGVNPVSLNAGSINYYQVDNVATATSYSWSLPRGFTAYGSSTTTTGPQISINTTNQVGTYLMLCRANNVCGSSWTNSLTINVVGSGGGGGIQMRAAYPNPTNDSFTVKLKDEDSKEPAEVSLFNKSMERVFFARTEETEIAISTLALLPGTYYLNIVIGKDIKQQQIVINH